MWLHTFVTSELDGGECSASHHNRFIPGERAPRAHRVRGWVDLIAGQDIRVAVFWVVTPCRVAVSYHNTEDVDLNIHCHPNLKSRMSGCGGKGVNILSPPLSGIELQLSSL